MERTRTLLAWVRAHRQEPEAAHVLRVLAEVLCSDPLITPVEVERALMRILTQPLPEHMNPGDLVVMALGSECGHGANPDELRRLVLALHTIPRHGSEDSIPRSVIRRRLRRVLARQRRDVRRS